MPNEISRQQNEPEFVDLLCASSGVHAQVMWLSGVQTILAISSAVLGPLVGLLLPQWKVYTTAYAGVVVLIDFFLLEPGAKKYQDLATRIQEAFDTRLFGLPWNRIRCHAPPDAEDIARWASKYRKSNDTNWLKNWYPIEASEIPLEYGRLVCQRANMRWDASLRRYYCGFFIAALSIMFLVALMLGVFVRWPADQYFLSVIFPFLPLVIKVWGECRKQLSSAASSDTAKSVLDSTWDKAKRQEVSAEELLNDSRRLQDELYDRRRQSARVPDWLYRRTRNARENEMKYGSRKMVNEILAKLELPPT